MTILWLNQFRDLPPPLFEPFFVCWSESPRAYRRHVNDVHGRGCRVGQFFSIRYMVHFQKIKLTGLYMIP